MFKSMTNLIAAIVLFGCVVVGSATMIRGCGSGVPEQVANLPDTSRQMLTSHIKPADVQHQLEQKASESEGDTADADAQAAKSNDDATTDAQAKQDDAATAGDKPQDESGAKAAEDKKTDTATAKTEPATPETYVVKKGDTLYGISRELLGNGGRWREIAAANGLSEGDLLLPGRKLKIPQAAESTAQ